LDPKVVEEYQKILAADPRSRVFAVLAEAYREMGLLDQAESLSRSGIANHPNYAPGYVALARLLIQKRSLNEAQRLLQKAVELSPDNLLAHQLLGEAFLQLKQPKDALRAHKMALFLNPNNQRSQQVVRKLESLTADEYEAEDLFAMKSLPEVVSPKPENLESRKPSLGLLERGLSVIDALLARQQADLAKEKLRQLNLDFPGHPELTNRWQLLGGSEMLEPATAIKPVASRERRTLDRKINRLKQVLTALQDRQNQPR